MKFGSRGEGWYGTWYGKWGGHIAVDVCLYGDKGKGLVVACLEERLVLAVAVAVAVALAEWECL
jgi:hypothetical protein